MGGRHRLPPGGRRLATQPREQVVLVLDDYHLIGARPVHAPLTFLLEHRPPGLAAGDAAWAARLAERHADRLLLLNEGATLRRWLGALPARLLRSRPRLLLTQAVLAAMSGRVDVVEAQLDAAERAWAAAAGKEDESFEPPAGS